MEKEITKLGLSENEARVYLSLLRLGSASAKQIAVHAKVKRPTTYVALENLMKQGVVSEQITDKKKLFKAEDPEKLKALTKKLRRQAMNAELAFTELLPQLKAMQKKIFKAPKLSFYQGTAGVRSIFENISESSKPWYFFGSSHYVANNFPSDELEEMIEDTDKLREKAGRPKVYMLTDEGILKFKHFQGYKPEVREIKILASVMDSKSALVIYGNKLAVIGVSDIPFGAIIENEEVTDMVRLMYMMIWEAVGVSGGVR